MVAKKVSTQQIPPVVAAVGGSHDGVPVERLGLVVVEEDALMAVKATWRAVERVCRAPQLVGVVVSVAAGLLRKSVKATLRDLVSLKVAFTDLGTVSVAPTVTHATAASVEPASAQVGRP
jgi:hypothetical protein